MTGQIAFAKPKPSTQRQQFGKGKVPAKFPANKPGMSGSTSKPRKALAPKKKK